MNLEIRAKYEGFKLARELDSKKTPDIDEIDNMLWELFFKDQSIQNRVLKRR